MLRAMRTGGDDARLGLLLKAIRQRHRLTQRALAGLAVVPREDVIRIEAGAIGSLPLDRVRRIFEAVGARATLGIWFNGAMADRLLDHRHAALVERALTVFRRRGWEVRVEVSFSEYGERGSIDLLAGHPTSRIAAICEVKSVFGSLEETNRVLDVKVRLGKKITRDTLGWLPTGGIARILIVPDEMTMRRTIARHAETMATLYPARGREVRAWLRRPVTPFGGIWFLSEVARSDSSSASLG